MAEEHILGLNKARRLLMQADEWVSEPWRVAMTDLSESGATAGQGRAPYRTGRLRGRIFARVQKGKFPRWAAVRSRAKSRGRRGRRGYDYPRLLEHSAKHGHKNWFTGSVYPALIGQAEDALAKAGNEIQQRWERY